MLEDALHIPAYFFDPNEVVHNEHAGLYECPECGRKQVLDEATQMTNVQCEDWTCHSKFLIARESFYADKDLEPSEIWIIPTKYHSRLINSDTNVYGQLNPSRPSKLIDCKMDDLEGLAIYIALMEQDIEQLQKTISQREETIKKHKDTMADASDRIKKALDEVRADLTIVDQPMKIEESVPSGALVLED